MSRRKTGQQNRPSLLKRHKFQLFIVTIVLGLFAAWTMLAYSGALDSVFRQKSKKGGTVSTASFNSNSPSKEYVYAGGRLVATEEPTGGVGCTPPSAPVLTTSIVNSTITLSWTIPSAAETFDVERKPTVSVLFGPIATGLSGTTSQWSDNINFSGVSSDGTNNVVTYIYRVVAHIGQCSTPSNPDWATNISFGEPLISQQTVIKAIHITELRVAVNSVWRAADQTPQPITWTDPANGGMAGLTGFQVKEAHVDELRTKLNQAMNAIQPGYSSQHPYNDPMLIQNSTPVRAIHLIDLRNRVK